MARILVIDDDQDVRLAVRKHLEVDGHDVIESADGGQALEVVRAAPPDLIITDVYMPGIDGIEFAIRLRETSATSALVAMSGGGFKDKEDVLSRAKALGAVATLEKPFTRDELIEAVEAGLRGS